ncbi:MAG TPA: hypothetical protein VFC58_01525 [Desulfosporosinus sp.]|nr:hypothetical protein [Desulfosporosinus sp.]
MAKKSFEGLGDQAVNKLFSPAAQEDREILDVDPSNARKSAAGRPPTIKREIEKSSQEGLPENWTRATFILREDLLKRLKDYSYTDRRSLKEIINEMIEDYLQNKDIIERGGK